MPDQIPVYTNQPLNPLQTMSSVLGLQQQKQALQTGQYAQQSADAGAQMDQRKAQEQSRVAQYISNPANKGKSADDMQDDIYSIAPTTGADVLTGLRKSEAVKAQVQTALTDLSAKNKSQVGDLIRSWSGGQHTPDQVHAQLDAAETINPQLKSVIEPIRASLEKMPPPGQARDAGIAQFAQMIDGKSGVTAGTIDNGPTIQPIKTDSQGNIIQTGKPIVKDLAPTQKLPYVAAAAAASTSGGKGAANDEDLYNTVQGQASQSAGIKSTAQDIKTLANEVTTGKYSKEKATMWTSLEQSFGINPKDDSETVRRQVLGKKVAQLRMQMEQAQGASTDAARSNTDAALPDPDHVAPGAVKSAANDVIGMADRSAARAQLANNHRQNNGGQSGGLRAVDNAFMSTADPRVYTYKNLQPGAERQEYLKEHFKSRGEIQDFLDKQSVLDHMTGGNK